jgi:hypothetical protein
LIIILIFTAKSIIHHDMIIFIYIFITHFITPGADVCIDESTLCFTMVGPRFVSFHKIAVYQMHLDGINIFPHKFVATIITRTTYLLCPRNLGMLLHNLKKVY